MDEDAGEAFFIGGGMKNINLTRGIVALIDDEDFEYVSQFLWHANGKKYAERHRKDENGRDIIVSMHREILKLGRGNSMKVDHINHVPYDNRRNNLRIVTHSQNICNQNKNSSNTSGFKGVTFHKVTQKWLAQISGDGKRRHLGLFNNPEDAYKAYCDAALKYHGECANFGRGCVILGENNDYH